MNRISKSLPACAPLSFSVGSNAVILSQAKAVLQSPTCTIYDATPGDGMAASAYFLDPVQAWRSQVFIGVTDYTGNDLGFDNHLGYSATGPAPQPVDVISGIWPVAGLGGAGGSWVADTGQVGAQGGSSAAGIGYYAYAGLSTTASDQWSPTFYNLVLGAGTGVVITAEGRAEVWLSHQGEYASAYTQL